MIPESDLWPLWSEAMSFHTVIQGADFFREAVASMNKRYGEPKDIGDFCMTGQVLNYESARAMYEAYARNKYDALGITAWKYDAAWPAVMTWQFVDWYLVPTGAYYGAKKACEPLHVQYSYDDQSIWVVNSWYRPYRGLRVSASICDVNMAQIWSKETTIDVGSDGKTLAFKVDMPASLSKVYFLRLNLTNARGDIVSDNLYWLSAVPDIPGEMRDDWLNFALNAKSVADFTPLRALPKVTLDTHCEFTSHGDEMTGRVRVANSTGTIAFFVNLAITAGERGPEVAPCYWEDNDFSVLPGETKQYTVTFFKADLGDKTPVLRVTGWNVAQSSGE
jgi:exo-1,4-beta-D-glucosaminidase